MGRKVGDVVRDNKDGTFEVISILSGRLEVPNWDKKEKLRVRFLNTGSEKVYFASSLMHDNVTDPCKPKILGVGFLGEGDYRARRSPSEGGEKFKSYRCWENMLWRVYGEHRLSNRYSGLGVTVDPRWHNFQNFCGWYLDNRIGEKGEVLDKDILKKGNKVYCPEFCRFVPQSLNKFFTSMNKNRGRYPVGVHKDKRKDLFRSSVEFLGQKYSKCFKTPEEAFLDYKEIKEFLLREFSGKLLDEGRISLDTYQACQTWAVEPYPE